MEDLLLSELVAALIFLTQLQLKQLLQQTSHSSEQLLTSVVLLHLI